MPEVVVPLDGGEGIHHKVSKQLHPNDGVDKEQHSHEHAYIGQSLRVKISSLCGSLDIL